MRTYEGMFLVESGVASKDWDNVVGEIERVLKTGGAEVLKLDKWDDRFLAYPIKKQKRATYILTNFKVPPDGVEKVKRECELSEMILRALILRLE
jgi:ribosomal protein S6